MSRYQKFSLILCASLVLLIAMFYQTNQSKIMLLEKQKVQALQIEKQKEEETQIQNIGNPEINVSAAIKSTGEYTFTMFTNLPDDTQIEGNIIHVKNDGTDENIDTFKGEVKNMKIIVAGIIDPVLFQEDSSARLKFTGSTEKSGIKNTFATKVYDYTKYFIPSELPDNQTDYEPEISKTLNIPAAYLIAEELSKTFGYTVEASTWDGVKLTTLSGNNSSVTLTGSDVYRVLISGTFPVNSLDYATMVNIIISDTDMSMWVMDQIDKSNNGNIKIDTKKAKNDMQIEFESYEASFSIVITPL